MRPKVQHTLARRNKVVPLDHRIEPRIGIIVGDVIVDGNDIYGDGVNVAARLEGLAKPGGITISGNVQEQIRDKLDFTFAYDESQKLLDTSLIIGLRRHE